MSHRFGQTHRGNASPIRLTQLQAQCQKQRVFNICLLLRLHFPFWELNTRLWFRFTRISLGFKFNIILNFLYCRMNGLLWTWDCAEHPQLLKPSKLHEAHSFQHYAAKLDKTSTIQHDKGLTSGNRGKQLAAWGIPLWQGMARASSNQNLAWICWISTIIFPKIHAKPLDGFCSCDKVTKNI